MTDQERNYYNTFVRIRDFGIENDDEIKTNAAALSNLALIGAGIDAIEASGEVQSSGAIGQGTTRKAFVLENLREEMQKINKTSRSLAVDNPALAELFRMPHGNNEQKMLAAARAFLTNATPIEQQFIGFGMSETFIANLQADITAYEQAIAQKNTAMDAGVGATANIGATIEETLKALRRLRGIIPNIFAGNSAKLAAWKSASHVEKLPKKSNKPS